MKGNSYRLDNIDFYWMVFSRCNDAVQKCQWPGLTNKFCSLREQIAWYDRQIEGHIEFTIELLWRFCYWLTRIRMVSMQQIFRISLRNCKLFELNKEMNWFVFKTWKIGHIYAKIYTTSGSHLSCIIHRFLDISVKVNAKRTSFM